MNSIEDNNLSVKDSKVKKESSTIELARKLGILKDEELLSINSNEPAEQIETTKNDNLDNNEFKVTPKDVESYFMQNSENSEPSKPNEYIDNGNKIGGILAFQSFEFKGKPKEYFKIWIVNIALTLLTLGVYSAWAKVRNLRYIYGNTYLNGSNFEFNAEPKRILYGRLIVFAFYAFFLFATDVLYNKELAGGILLVFLLLLPWLIKQAIRFKLKSTSYRNIRFKFHGKARSFYGLVIVAILGIVAVFLPIVLQKYMHLDKDIAASIYAILFFVFLIIGIPLIYKKFKELVVNNSSYGEAMFSFNATKRGAVGTFLKIAFSTFIAGFFFALLVIIPTKFFNLSFGQLDITSKNTTMIIGAILGSVLYLSFVGLYKGITDGYLSNFTRNNTKLEDGEFKSTINPFRLGFISMTNILATVLSLGLLYPWAKMRYLKYKLENTQFACRDYDRFVSTHSKDVSTVGEEAVDFFDIDIGV